MQILKSPDNGEEWIFSRDDMEMNTSPRLRLANSVETAFTVSYNSHVFKTSSFLVALVVTFNWGTWSQLQNTF